MFAALASSLGCGLPNDPPSARPREDAIALPRPSAQRDLPDPSTMLGDAGATVALGDAMLAKLASIAIETPIYDEPRWAKTRIGYLRAGAIIKRSEAPATAGPRCPGGWYRVEPRGFVCVGAMASLDLDHPVVTATAQRPKLDDLPYDYVLSRAPPPPLYAKLPDLWDTLRFEPERSQESARGATDPSIPSWLLPGNPSVQLGNAPWRGDRVSLGRARPRSGFALLSTLEHRGRRYGVTTSLELVPLDRTRPVVRSTFRGVELEGVGLPIAFLRRHGGYRVIRGPRGLTPGGAIGFREAVAVTGEEREEGGVRYLVARDGSLIPASLAVMVKAMRHPPAWAREGKKWIEVSIPRQTLVAWEGETPVYATLVSTGVGGTGDPATTHATVRGAFTIYEKHVAVTMNGREAADPFDLRDVPFVQYFHEGYALHAAYWHDDFGRVKSHGCVNLSPRDAAWLFRFTDPHLPEGWHGVTRTGTIVYIHD